MPLVVDRADHREAEFEVRREPVGVERVARFVQVGDHVVEIHLR